MINFYMERLKKNQPKPYKLNCHDSHFFCSRNIKNVQFVLLTFILIELQWNVALCVGIAPVFSPLIVKQFYFISSIENAVRIQLQSEM